MAEEMKVAAEGEQKPVDEKPALTEIEQRANQQGWVPQDEWEGDPDQWRPAKEFLDRGELFKKIDEQNRTIKEFKKALEEFGKHHSKVQKVEYERAKADLLKSKKEALEEGDADAVIDIDEKLALVRDAAKNIPANSVNIPDPAEQNVVFQSWVGRNSWYENNMAMRAYADRVGNDLGAKGGMSPTDLLAAVEKEVKKEFAHKFQNPNRDKAGNVEGSSNRAGGKKDTYVPTAQEERIIAKVVASGAITREKYIEELKKVNGV